jgi:hypothetical protein
MDEIELTPTPDPHSPNGVYIPTDIQDCFQELDRLIPANIREKIRIREEADLTQNHFDLGIWMRNNWGLWLGHSRLKQYFDSLGVHDADSISSLILASYWRYLNGRPIELPRQIVYDKISRDEIKNGPQTGNLS